MGTRLAVVAVALLAPAGAQAQQASYDDGTLTDGQGSGSVVTEQITVTGPPTADTVQYPLPTPKPPVLMRPFPIVRIAGTVLPRAAILRVLSVRSPRASRVRVRCTGRGCPVRSVSRTSATGFLRFQPFERRLRAGTRLEVFVRKPGRIGKYTRFLIRAGKPPARVDRCLIPGQERPVSCP